MSWLSEWIAAGKIRLPQKYNSIGDLRKALKQELTPEVMAKIVAGVNKQVDMPMLDEAQEAKLIETILAYGFKALLGE
jgi:hypothetical protein